MIFHFLQDLAGQYDHGRCTITHFGVLRAGYISQDSGCGMNNVEKLSDDQLAALASQKRRSYLHNRSAVIRNGLLAICIDKK